MAPQSGQPRSASQVRRLVEHRQPPNAADAAYRAFVSIKINRNTGVVCGAVEQKGK